ncbi:hypothetical protein [Limnohabitans sp.]|uniref:hypothetical protein n=1 Tax=Limnohabitans sp. TaxID=1907725 RepID=UPI0038BA377B
MKVKTVKARRVLSDATEALEKFNDKPIDVDFRHLVVLCTVLIRAVGHVLESENENDSVAAKKSNDYYKKYIAHDNLFKGFIKSTRDSAIKEYTTYVGWASVTTIDKDHRMEYLFKGGENEGKDFRDLMKKSVDFWNIHLTRIEEL